MDAESLEPALPAAAVPAEATEHDDLAPDLAQLRDPVFKEPHRTPARAGHDLLVDEAGEEREGRRLKVLLLDGHDDSLGLGLLSCEKSVYYGEDFLERRFLWIGSVVCHQSVVFDGEPDVEHADTGGQLRSEWCIERLALGDRPAIERHTAAKR